MSIALWLHCPDSAHTERCSLCEAVIKRCLWNGALRVGLCCILADAAARLSVGTGRGRGRRDAVAPQHRFTHVVTSCYCFQRRKKRKEKKCCNMTSTELSGKLSVHQHPRLWKVRILCAASAQIDCDQPSANIALPNAPNVKRREQEREPVFLHVKLLKSGVEYYNRWLIISSSASCKPEHDHQPTMSLSSSWYHLARPLLRRYAHLSTGSFPLSFITNPSFDPDKMVKSRLIDVCCFIPPRFFHNRAAWPFLKEPGRKAPPQDQTVRNSDNHNPPQHTANKTFWFTVNEPFRLNFTLSTTSLIHRKCKETSETWT